LAKGQHVRPLGKPAAYSCFQNGRVVRRAVPLAVYYAYATEVAFVAGIQKYNQFALCFFASVPVQIELGLDFPVAAPESPQCLAGNARAGKRPLVAGADLEDQIRGKAISCCAAFL